MNIRIYQINADRDYNCVRFESLEELERIQGSTEIDSSIYDCVFAGEVECIDLEDVYQKFNIDHPEGYRGRSLSKSDVVEVIEADGIELGFYYCDRVGFKSIEFDPDGGAGQESL